MPMSTTNIEHDKTTVCEWLSSHCGQKKNIERGCSRFHIMAFFAPELQLVCRGSAHPEFGSIQQSITASTLLSASHGLRVIRPSRLHGLAGPLPSSRTQCCLSTSRLQIQAPLQHQGATCHMSSHLSHCEVQALMWPKA